MSDAISAAFELAKLEQRKSEIRRQIQAFDHQRKAVVRGSLQDSHLSQQIERKIREMGVLDVKIAELKEARARREGKQ